jgi:hypothetical protein
MLFHFFSLKKLQVRGIKKNPRTNIKIDPGIAFFYPQTTQVCSLSTGAAILFSDRSSDFRIVLPVAPSQPHI